LGYLQQVDTEVGGSFASRHWLIEIIDKSSMKPTETYHGPNGEDFDVTDAVYNQLERAIIYVE